VTSQPKVHHYYHWLREHVFRVPSLTVPPADLASPERLVAFESVQLFAEDAALHQRGFTVDDVNAAAVAAICVRFDGIPPARLSSRIAAMEMPRLTDSREGQRTALPLPISG
jgi:predicted ATPase